MKLEFDIVTVANITALQKHEMFRLMECHYANMVWDEFIHDLAEKHWVILLFSDDCKLVGFSTQLLIIPDEKSALESCVVIYSGDTIIAQEYWGSMALSIAFLQLVHKIQKDYPDKTVYWMLISKGLRTYKYLSVFFNEYYPNYLTETPLFIKQLMNYLGRRKFGYRYNAKKGIIKAMESSQYLRDTFQPEEKKDNKVAAFFYAANPGYSTGDELLCIGNLSDSNIHSFIKRMVKNYVH